MEIGQVSASSLKLDVLISIFSYLDTRSKGRTAQVCKAWMKAINDKSLWKNYKFELQSGNCNLFTYCNILDRGINQFKLIGFKPGFFEFLEKVPHLESIQLNDSCLNIDLELFLPTNELQRLNLSHCLDVTDQFLEVIISHLPSLVELDLSYCNNITYKGFRMLASNMKKLRILHLNGNMATSSNYRTDKKIASLTGSYLQAEGAAFLEHLYLRDNSWMSDKALKCISRRFVNLVSLEFNSYRISDAGLSYLVRFKNLKFLNLHSCHEITDIGMKSIIQLSNLNFLDVACCWKVSDVGFQNISQLMNLKSLNLESCNGITDITLKYLTQLKSLRILSLKRCAISDKGLAYLSDSELKLRELDLSYCRRIGYSGLLKISQSSIACTLYTLALNQYPPELFLKHFLKKFRHLRELKF